MLPYVERSTEKAEQLNNFGPPVALTMVSETGVGSCETKSRLSTAPAAHTVKNIRISTDILWRFFHILTEPVPYRPT